jgi:hypothetical protein
MTELPVIDPPPGGLERLRQRIAADDRRRPMFWLVPALALAAAIAIWLARPHHAPRVEAAALVPDTAIGATFFWVSPQPARSAPTFVDISAVTITP